MGSTLTRSLAYLRLNGVKAREHPVFIELTRVKQYFDKIKAAETPAERNKTVDKAAAARFIKAGLVSQDSMPGFLPGTYSRTTNSLQAGNDKYDLERAEQQAKERARAHIKFERTPRDIASKRKVHEVEGGDEDSDSSESDSSSESSAAAPEEASPAPGIHIKTKKKKKPKIDNSDSAQTSGNSTPQGTSKKARAKAAKKAKREKLKVKRERKKQKRMSEK